MPHPPSSATRLRQRLDIRTEVVYLGLNAVQHKRREAQDSLGWLLRERTMTYDEKSKRANVTLPGKVEKIIESPLPSEPEKAQISVERGEELYREIRIENSLTDENGDEVRLKERAEVEVTVEADKDATTPKKQ